MVTTTTKILQFKMDFLKLKLKKNKIKELLRAQISEKKNVFHVFIHRFGALKF